MAKDARLRKLWRNSKDYRLRILIQSLVWIPAWVAASSYSTVRLKTQPEPHECILLCISHHTQILWWSEQFSSSNRGCSFACESCKTTQSHQWFFEPDGLCVVWVHPEAKQCETVGNLQTYPAGAASAPFSHLSCLVGAASRSQRWFVWTPSPPHSGNKPSWSLKSSPHERGGRKPVWGEVSGLHLTQSTR